MSDYKDDSDRRIEDLIRHIIEQAENRTENRLHRHEDICPGQGNSRGDPPITPLSVRAIPPNRRSRSTG